MRATRVLQKCLSDGLQAMHAMRSRVLLSAVEALLAGRRLTLMDVARSWPEAERVSGAGACETPDFRFDHRAKIVAAHARCGPD